MNEEKNIFDRLMSLQSVLRLQSFYQKNKEILLYLLFGGLTFIVSIASYAFCNIVIGLNELIANVISWILAVTFAYLTNRKWVFESKASAAGAIAKEVLSFFAGRLLTLVVEEGILFAFITCLHLSSVPVKIAAQVVVIISNYFISKLMVFRKTKEPSQKMP